MSYSSRQSQTQPGNNPAFDVTAARTLEPFCDPCVPNMQRPLNFEVAVKLELFTLHVLYDEKGDDEG